MDNYVKKLLEVLKFYADPKQYHDRENSFECHGEMHYYTSQSILIDKGEKARQCIKEFEEIIQDSTEDGGK